MRVLPVLLLIAVLAPPALSMPVDEPKAANGPVHINAPGPDAEVVRERLRLQEEYRRLREERRSAQAKAVTRAERGRAGSTGWKTESLDPLAAPAGDAGDAGNATAPESEAGGSWLLWIGGAAVVLFLLVKVFRPDLLSRKPRKTGRMSRRTGPIRITAPSRPVHPRPLSRPRARP